LKKAKNYLKKSQEGRKVYENQIMKEKVEKSKKGEIDT
jgi:hypothetical protein